MREVREVVPIQSRADPRATAPIRVDDLARLATQIRLRAVHMVGIQGFGYLGQAALHDLAVAIIRHRTGLLPGGGTP